MVERALQCRRSSSLCCRRRRRRPYHLHPRPRRLHLPLRRPSRRLRLHPHPHPHRHPHRHRHQVSPFSALARSAVAWKPSPDSCAAPRLRVADPPPSQTPAAGRTQLACLTLRVCAIAEHASAQTLRLRPLSLPCLLSQRALAIVSQPTCEAVCRLNVRHRRAVEPTTRSNSVQPEETTTGRAAAGTVSFSPEPSGVSTAETTRLPFPSTWRPSDARPTSIRTQQNGS